MVRILVHDFAGHPFQVQLSRELARRGHDVTHAYCPSYVTGRGRLEALPGDPDTLRIVPLALKGTFAKHAPVRRISQELAYGHQLVRLVRDIRPEAVLSANTPLLAQWRLLRASHAVGARFAYWQQDVFSLPIQQFARRLLGGLGKPAAEFFSSLEARTLRASDVVIPISDAFLPLLDRWRVPRERIAVIPNWAPLDELPPQPKDNPWSRRFGLQDRFVFLYAGTLGLKHNAELLLILARHLNTIPDALLLVINEGPGAELLAAAARSERLTSLRVLPFQPYPDLPLVLGAADVLLAVLTQDAGAYSVPSKILTYLCAERPILAALPPSNPAAALLTQHNAGIVVPPDDPSAFLSAALELHRQPALRSSLSLSARKYAAAHFHIPTLANRFLPLLHPHTNTPSAFLPAPLNR